MTIITPIQFGTSGHRGIMTDGFTNEHLKVIAQALYTLFSEDNLPLTLIIGYDPRQGNDPHRSQHSFTKVLVDSLVSLGFTIYFCATYCPTPVISWAITHYKLSGGLILTASHNPPQYNGIKFNPKNGAPAPTEMTKRIETLGNIYLNNPLKVSREAGQIIPISPEAEFSKHLFTLVSTYFSNPPELPSFPKIIIDCKHGATAETWKHCLSYFPVTPILINESPKSDFGGIEPNPTIESSITALKKAITDHQAILGIANDPDGDRHVILDENGTALIPEETALIIARELCTIKIPLKVISGSVASSAHLKEFCQKNNIQFDETPVGFKYFAPIFETARKNRYLAMGVESSGGFSLSSHTFEKCGFLPALLILAIVLQKNTALSQLKKELLKTLSPKVFLEKAIPFSEELKEKIKEKLTNQSNLNFPIPIQNQVRTDGLKLIIEPDSWILFRLSGTEPVVRLYCETPTNEKSHSFLTVGTEWLLG